MPRWAPAQPETSGNARRRSFILLVRRLRNLSIMRKRSFGRVLDGIVTLALASTVGAVGAAGCSGGTAATGDGGVGDGGTVDGGFVDDDTFTCATPLAEIVSNLKPGTPVDYVELRTQTVPNPNYHPYPPAEDAGDAGAADAGPPPLVLKTLSTNGQPCATATNKDACTTALAKASGKGWGPFSDGGNAAAPPTIDVQFLVYTRGNEVGIAGSTEELAAFLGPVDTLEEARLLLLSQGHALACAEGSKAGWRQNPDGSWEIIVPGGVCSGVIRFRYRIGKDGTVTQVGTEPNPEPVACGRRPEGLVDNGAGGGFAIGLGEYFAEVAYLEAASVVAFRRLELELRRFGAPRELVERARRARADEIRHARETAALARRFGGDVRALEVGAATERELLAIAIENAAEGCVRETYGALVAAFQARKAKDPEVRAVLARIARDEARHAELSHDVAIWLDGKLDAASRALVEEERTRALDELRAAIEAAPAADVVEHAGMPTVYEARALLAGLEHEVLLAA